MIMSKITNLLKFWTVIFTILVSNYACSEINLPGLIDLNENKNEETSTFSQEYNEEEVTINLTQNENTNSNQEITETAPNNTITQDNNNNIFPTIKINPNAGPIGTEHLLELIDFTPNSIADIYSYYIPKGNQILSFQVPIDNSGNGWAYILTEPGDDFGQYKIFANDQSSGLSAETTFLIEEDVLINPWINIVPEIGPVGTLHAVELVDFTPNSIVNIDFFYQDTGALALSVQEEIDEYGYAVQYVRSDSEDDIGTILVKVTDTDDALITESSFAIKEATNPSKTQFTILTSQANLPSDVQEGSRINFNSVYVGSQSYRVALLQNTGTVPLEIASYEFKSPNPDDFYIPYEIIGAKLEPDQMCYIYFTFRPLATGEKLSKFRIQSNETNEGVASFEIDLYGIGKINTLGFASYSSAITASSDIPDCHKLVY